MRLNLSVVSVISDSDWILYSSASESKLSILADSFSSSNKRFSSDYNAHARRKTHNKVSAAVRARKEEARPTTNNQKRGGRARPTATVHWRVCVLTPQTCRSASASFCASSAACARSISRASSDSRSAISDSFSATTWKRTEARGAKKQRSNNARNKRDTRRVLQPS